MSLKTFIFGKNESEDNEEDTGIICDSFSPKRLKDFTIFDCIFGVLASAFLAVCFVLQCLGLI